LPSSQHTVGRRAAPKRMAVIVSWRMHVKSQSNAHDGGREHRQVPQARLRDLDHSSYFTVGTIAIDVSTCGAAFTLTARVAWNATPPTVAPKVIRSWPTASELV
jgi:hypothetical protein